MPAAITPARARGTAPTPRPDDPPSDGLGPAKALTDGSVVSVRYDASGLVVMEHRDPAGEPAGLWAYETLLAATWALWAFDPRDDAGPAGGRRVA